MQCKIFQHSPMSLSASERYMCGVQGSRRLGNRNARSPMAMTRLLRTAGSTVLRHMVAWVQDDPAKTEHPAHLLVTMLREILHSARR